MSDCSKRLAVVALAAALAATAGLAQQDRKGCEDHPLLSRMAGYSISSCQKLAFASHKFQMKKGTATVEGRLTRIDYVKPREAEPTSGLEVIRNYTNAVKAIGGTVTYEGRYSASMKVNVGGHMVWIEVEPGPTHSYKLYIVEKKEMEQRVVADAKALLEGLNRSGKAVIHGILFDTDSDVIKPGSEPALEEVAKLLRENPKMSAFVVGHTDMVGSWEHNLDLSAKRAAAVVEALVTKYGISRDRLTARGVGPLAPLGTNDTEEGRALNRRVELVKR